jgi:hypothetical protein
MINKIALSERFVYKAIANAMNKKHALEAGGISKWPNDRLKSFVLNTEKQYKDSSRDVLRVANKTTFTSPFYRDMAKSIIKIVKKD